MNSKSFSLKVKLISMILAFLFSHLATSLSNAEEKAEFPLMKVGERYTATDKYRTWTWEVKQVKDDKSFIIDEQQEDSQDVEKINVDKNYYISSSGKLRNITLNFPLFVGKKWSDSFIDQSPQYTNQSFRYDAKYEVVEYKLLKIPAGEFKAYKISVTITNKDSFRAVHNYETYNGDVWYSPDLKMIVKANIAPYASYTITAYSPFKDALTVAKEESDRQGTLQKQKASSDAVQSAVSKKKEDEPRFLPASKPKQELAPEIITQEEEKVLPPKLHFKAFLADENNNNILDGGEAITLVVDVENKGEGTASNVSVNLTGNQTLLAYLGDKKNIGHIKPGEKKTARFKGYLPIDIPEMLAELKILVKESKGYSPLNAQLIKVAMRPSRVTDTVFELSDIDVDDVPPKGSETNDNYAVVIGISKYRDKNIPEVKYARRDAETMAAYLENVAGLSKANIKLLTDDGATKSDLEEQMENWLKRRARPNSTVFVYYSGHGTPDVEGKEAFIVPYEGHPDSPYKLYPLKSMYESLNKLSTKNVVVMLDSCFSGAEGRSVTKQGTRPLVVSLQTTALSLGKVLVLAASEGSQISSDYEKGRHGLFTYYLLRGMRGEADTDLNGTVDMSELYDYVKKNVAEKASIELNRDQTPVLLPAIDAADARLKTPIVKSGKK